VATSPGQVHRPPRREHRDRGGGPARTPRQARPAQTIGPGAAGLLRRCARWAVRSVLDRRLIGYGSPGGLLTLFAARNTDMRRLPVSRQIGVKWT
jgi:hypothetical protein